VTPDTYTIQETFVEVGDGHTLYIHDWGHKEASTPIIFLHGGPGGSSKDRHKQLFDPNRERVIFFDQRGCGQSTPYGSLEHNTTSDIIGDIKKIIDHLKLGEVILTGSSWGCALAFFFAIAHPNQVKALVVNGIWTGSKAENGWLDKGGFRTFYPEVWETYANSVPAEYRDDPSSYHFPRILSGDAEASKVSGYAYEKLEGAAIQLDDRFTPDSFETYDPADVRLEVSYLTNLCFMPDRYIFDNASKLTMPIYMVQGRYDMICPPSTAHELHQLLPHSELIMTTSGHKTERESWTVIRTLLLQLSGDA